VLSFLLDQNVPQSLCLWLKSLPQVKDVYHVAAIGMCAASDESIFHYAQKNRLVIITFDEDFADRRLFPVASHCGIVRLKVWPTTLEVTTAALERVFQSLAPEEIAEALVIVDNTKIRLRKHS